MIPPCAQNVFDSCGSFALVTTTTFTPWSANSNAAVAPAIPLPTTRTSVSMYSVKVVSPQAWDWD